MSVGKEHAPYLRCTVSVPALSLSRARRLINQSRTNKLYHHWAILDHDDGERGIRVCLSIKQYIPIYRLHENGMGAHKN
jgi:hypothetical protein